MPTSQPTSQPANGRDRRRDPRTLISLAVDIGSGNNFYAGRTRDISVGGVFIETDAALPIGTELMLRLRIGRLYFLSLATVAWELADSAGRPVGVGARFVDPPRAMRSAIEEIVRVKPPIPFEEPEGDEAPRHRGP